MQTNDKLREALVKAQTAFVICEWPDGTRMEGVAELLRQIDAALAAPPRNCDKYENAKDAWFAFDALQSKKGAKWHWTEYADWLFAPAQEGGANG